MQYLTFRRGLLCVLALLLGFVAQAQETITLDYDLTTGTVVALSPSVTQAGGKELTKTVEGTDGRIAINSSLYFSGSNKCLYGDWNTASKGIGYLSITQLKAGDVVTFKLRWGWDVNNLIWTSVDGVTETKSSSDSTIVYTVTGSTVSQLDFVQKEKNMLGIRRVTIQTTGGESVSAPTAAITAVNGLERTVTITPGVSTAGNDVNTYYTLDGSTPTVSSTLYEAPFTLTHTADVKAISISEGTDIASGVAEKRLHAGLYLKQIPLTNGSIATLATPVTQSDGTSLSKTVAGADDYLAFNDAWTAKSSSLFNEWSVNGARFSITGLRAGEVVTLEANDVWTFGSDQMQLLDSENLLTWLSADKKTLKIEKCSNAAQIDFSKVINNVQNSIAGITVEVSVPTACTVPAGTWQSLCLPFDMEATAFTHVGRIMKVADGTVTIIPASTIEAGVCYVVKADAPVACGATEGEEITVLSGATALPWGGGMVRGYYNADAATYQARLTLEDGTIVDPASLEIEMLDWQDIHFYTSIENDRARAYLIAAEEYDEQSTTIISKYNNGLPLRRDQPCSVIIPLSSHTSALQLSYSESRDLANAITIDISAETQDAAIDNLYPARTYYYKVTDGTSAIVTQGQFSTEGNLRMIRANSVSNIRDLGGWTTTDYRRVRYGLVYRGGEFNGKNGHTATADDIALLRDLGIKAELDLRSATWDTDMSYSSASALGNDIAYRFSNQMEFSTLALSADTARTKWADNFRFIVQNLQQERPVYFHCVWGADRTGAMAFLLEGLLGVKISDMYRDYELTTFSEAGDRLKSGLDSKFAYIRSVKGVTMRDKFYNYFTDSLGIEPALIESFRSIMLEDYDGGITVARADYDALKLHYQQIITLAATEWNPSEADAAANAATTVTAMTAAQATLTAAFQTAMNALDHQVELTSLLTNPNFATHSTTGWMVNTAPGFHASRNVAEYYQTAARITQVLKNMPAGHYTLLGQAFMRTGEPATAYTAYQETEPTVTSYMLFNDERCAVHNIYDCAQAAAVYAGSESNPATGIYVPNTLGAADVYFTQEGIYWNILRPILAEVSDIQLGLQTNSTASYSWTAFGGFRLFYGPDKQDVTLSDTEDFTPPVLPIIADVTTRALAADRWNTLCLPFDISADRIAEAGITEIRQLDDVDISGTTAHINFAESRDIKAGRPYIVKVETTGPITLDNVLITPQKAMTQPTAQGATMTGCYSPVTLRDVYYISSNLFYYADIDQPMNGYRAYITLPESAGVKVMNIVRSEEQLTVIKGVEDCETSVNSTCYDLSGRRISHRPAKGLYIQGGKKRLVP